MEESHSEKWGEARTIIDRAREKGVSLRLLGGLAIRHHCEIVDFCERDYSDIDMVGLGRQRNKIAEVFSSLGYAADAQFNALHGARRLSFENSGGEHIDIFLDRFGMEHDLDFSGRLAIEEYTLPLSDLLLTKLQIHRITEKDIRDSITILKDCDIGEADAPHTINVDYVAEICSRDWGLYMALLDNLDVIAERLQDYTLIDEEKERVSLRLSDLKRRLIAHPKTLKWKARSKLGKHLRWYEEVEER